ncbi:terminase [Gottfriedia luciferensis]|uniref:Terminase n=1 Tax=Gottfriedia luciferensis TaxID=178774 RepID=A0ABX2ZVC1_9BACI|nr:phage terminase small subunit P27 family [Gottfriedia luciferensis]ODG93728.1 terminase [Gottfriedia luciferensis]
MARPSKSVKTMSKNLTKEEIKLRTEQEDKLRGDQDNISPPSHLNARQKRIFSYIVSELKNSGILGNLDVYVLASCSIAIDRIQEIEKTINKDFNSIFDKNLMSAKEKYSKEFFRCTNELSLSPQSRAKLSNINIQHKESESDPLLKALKVIK